MMKFFKDKIFASLFLAACVLSTFPVLSNLFVLSLDGPAHLYNSKLIIELIKGNTAINQYFAFNTTHVTNWTGHIILALFNLVAPAWIAQKVFLTFLVILFPFSFSLMVCRLNFDMRYLSFAIFPFSYSVFFFYGFYNFILAIIFFFLWMAVALKESPVYTRKEKFLIFILLLLIECSHVFVFLIACGIFFIYMISAAFRKNSTGSQSILKNIFLLLKKFFILISGALVLFLYYFFHNTGSLIEKQEVPTSWREIFFGVFNVSPALGLGEYAGHLVFTRIFFCLLIFISVIFFIRKKSSEHSTNSIFILLAALALLLSYCLSMIFLNHGLYIQERCLLMFFLLWLTWITLHKTPRILQILLVVYCVFISVLFISYYQKHLTLLSRRCYNIYDTGWKIEKNARVFCLNFSNHWMEHHVLDYLGADNSIVLYDNYECFQNHFPLKWKNKQLVRNIEYDFDNGLYSKIVSENVDYIAILGEPEQTGRSRMNQSLVLTKNHFYKIAVSEDNRLFIYKKK